MSPQLGMCLALKTIVGFRSEPLFCPLCWTWTFSAFCHHSKYPLPFPPLPHSTANHRTFGRGNVPESGPCFFNAFASPLQVELILCSQIIFDVGTKQLSPYNPSRPMHQSQIWRPLDDFPDLITAISLTPNS